MKFFACQHASQCQHAFFSKHACSDVPFPDEGMTTATSGVLARFPWLLPFRNSCELRGLCRHSYFGPRTFGGGGNQCHRSGRVLMASIIVRSVVLLGPKAHFSLGVKTPVFWVGAPGIHSRRPSLLWENKGASSALATEHGSQQKAATMDEIPGQCNESPSLICLSGKRLAIARLCAGVCSTLSQDNCMLVGV